MKCRVILQAARPLRARIIHTKELLAIINHDTVRRTNEWHICWFGACGAFNFGLRYQLGKQVTPSGTLSGGDLDS